MYRISWILSVLVKVQSILRIERTSEQLFLTGGRLFHRAYVAMCVWVVMTRVEGGCYWPLVARGQGCCQIPHKAQECAPVTAKYQSKLPIVLGLTEKNCFRESHLNNKISSFQGTVRCVLPWKVNWSGVRSHPRPGSKRLLAL